MCAWEGIQLRHTVPASWDEAAEKLRDQKVSSLLNPIIATTTTTTTTATVSTEPTDPSQDQGTIDMEITDATNADHPLSTQQTEAEAETESKAVASITEAVEPRLSSNLAAWMYLLAEIPSCVGPLFQGKSIGGEEEGEREGRGRRRRRGCFRLLEMLTSYFDSRRDTHAITAPCCRQCAAQSSLEDRSSHCTCIKVHLRLVSAW